MPSWKEIRARMQALNAQASAIADQAEKLGRDLTPAESAQLDEIFAEFNRIAPPEKPTASYYRKLRLKIALAGAG
jgi:hypothetical protein